MTGPVPPTPGTSWARGPQGRRSTVHATLSTEIRAVPAPFSRTGGTFSVDCQEPMTPKAKNPPSRTVALYSRHTGMHRQKADDTKEKNETAQGSRRTPRWRCCDGEAELCAGPPRPAALPPLPLPAAAARTASGPSARLAPASSRGLVAPRPDPELLLLYLKTAFPQTWVMHHAQKRVRTPVIPRDDKAEGLWFY